MSLDVNQLEVALKDYKEQQAQAVANLNALGGAIQAIQALIARPDV